jgi:hypothetical protein
MKLHAEEAAGFGYGHKAFGTGDCDRSLGSVGMGEVKGLSVRLDRSPADSRDPTRTKANGAAWEKCEARDSTILLRLVERELEPETDPERGATRCDPLPERIVEPPLAEAAHRALCRADPRQHSEIGCCDVTGARRDPSVCAEALERDGD